MHDHSGIRALVWPISSSPCLSPFQFLQFYNSSAVWDIYQLPALPKKPSNLVQLLGFYQGAIHGLCLRASSSVPISSWQEFWSFEAIIPQTARTQRCSLVPHWRLTTRTRKKGKEELLCPTLRLVFESSLSMKTSSAWLHYLFLFVFLKTAGQSLLGNFQCTTGGSTKPVWTWHGEAL